MTLRLGLFIAAVILQIVFGLIALASASPSWQGNLFLTKQLFWLGLGIAASLFTLKFRWEGLRKHALWVLLGSCLLLLLVFIPGIGIQVNGARRWLGLGVFRVQVSEVAKLGLIFCLAHYLALHQRQINNFVQGFCVPIGLIGLFCALIIIEPDFGTSFLCGCVGITLLFLVGGALRYLIPCFAGGIFLMSVAIYFDPVRFRRILSFLDPIAYRQTGAYQLWQGLMAFASGKIHGLGLGNGRQKIYFLPEAHTDFIFPTIGEEWGLWGTLSIVLLYLTMTIIGFSYLRQANQLFEFVLVAGSLFFIVFQAAFNLGVVTGLLPTKGIALPFISYGGSGLLLMIVFASLAIKYFFRWEKEASALSKT